MSNFDYGYKRILCIDDDAKGLRTREAVLIARGYDVITAASGREGLSRLRDEKVDLVLLDYSMPDMDGVTVALEIRKRWTDLPIIILSGHDMSEIPKRMFRLVDGFISKGPTSVESFSVLSELTFVNPSLRCSLRVRDAMTWHPICFRQSESAASVARAMRDSNIGSAPVISDMKTHTLVGIITDRDLCCRVLAERVQPNTSIAGFITHNPVTCRPEQSLESCEMLMRTNQIRRVVVVDAKGSCIGIVSQADVALSEKADRVHKTLVEISKRPSTFTLRSIA